METELPKRRKSQTAQEVFRNLRDKTKVEMFQKKQQIEEARDRALAAKAEKERKKMGVAEDPRLPKRKESLALKAESDVPKKEKKVEIQETTDGPPMQRDSSPNDLPKRDNAHGLGDVQTKAVEKYDRYPKRHGTCNNCCGGLPGQGPGSALGDAGGGRSCCTRGSASRVENRLRGGSDDTRSSETDREGKSLLTQEFRESSLESEYEKPRKSIDKVFDLPGESTEIEVKSRIDNLSGNRVERLQGGCGGGGCCEFSPHSATRTFRPSRVDQCQRDSIKLNDRRSCRAPTSACQRHHDLSSGISLASTEGGCPCGGYGTATRSDNPTEPEIDGGYCGGSRLRGLSCKCKCQSCTSSRPVGGCGGQSCGRIYSCAGSGGGRCCFPRNYKRRSNADCCGGANPNCGGCC